MPNIAECVKVLQDCYADLETRNEQNAAEQLEVAAALKALGSAPASALTRADMDRIKLDR